MVGTDKFRGTVSKCSVQTPWRELTWKIGIEILLQSTSLDYSLNSLAKKERML